MNGLNKGRRIRCLILSAVLAANILITACSPAQTEDNTVSKSSVPEEFVSEKRNGKPLKREDTKEVAAEIITDEKGQPSFDIRVDDFIGQYNRCCKNANEEALLPESGEWSVSAGKGGVLDYIFSNQEAPDFYPSMHLYLSKNSGRIQEIAVYYDDHDYREETFRAFEKMCCCSLKSLYPKAVDEKLSSLVKTVHNSDVPAGQEYEPGGRPAVLYHRDGIGVYLYRRGWSSMYFCMIPVTKERLQSLKEKGTVLKGAF